MATFKIAVLGAQGVGKSAIVRQFLYNEFSEVCVPTTARRVYLPAVVMNGHVHDLQIMDFPPITAFPVNTLQVGAHPAPCDGTPMLGGGVSLVTSVGFHCITLWSQFLLFGGCFCLHAGVCLLKAGARDHILMATG